MSTPTRTSERALAALLCVAAVAFCAPFVGPIVLAAWFADLLHAPIRRIEAILGGRRRAVSALLVVVVLAVVLLLTGLVVLVLGEARDLGAQLRTALEGRTPVANVLLGGAAPSDARGWFDLAGRFGASAWGAALSLVRASASAAIALVVFVVALYTFSVDGRRVHAWLQAHAPISPEALRRLADAFRETGRGLLVAGCGTALLQGLVATIAFVALGIPRALLLGPLSALCAIVPVVGTALVWAPVAIELAATGHTVRAVIMVAAGVVIGTIDNVVRPSLARYGRLRLPTLVVLVSMLGGAALLGAVGVLLGPLVVRLAVEALEIVSTPATTTTSEMPKNPRERRSA